MEFGKDSVQRDMLMETLELQENFNLKLKSAHWNLHSTNHNKPSSDALQAKTRLPQTENGTLSSRKEENTSQSARQGLLESLSNDTKDDRLIPSKC